MLRMAAAIVLSTIRDDGNVRIDDLALRFIGFDEGGRYMFGS